MNEEKEGKIPAKQLLQPSGETQQTNTIKENLTKPSGSNKELEKDIVNHENGTIIFYLISNT